MRCCLFILNLVFFTIIASSVYSQGCSDAGACSIHSLNEIIDTDSSHNRVHLSIEQSFGLGEHFTFISQTTAGIQYRILKNTLLELRVPFMVAYGNLGQTSGVGDLILSINQPIFYLNKQNLNLIVAARLKTNNANFSFNGKPLPMAYQTSLGTYDAISGLIYAIPHWDFYLAYQHSFGRNKNAYLVTDLTLPNNEKYFESAQLKRGDDLYFRLRRDLKLRNENSIVLTLLSIYRLQKDEIIKDGFPVILDRSQGLTINLGFTWSKHLKSGQTMDLMLSFPIVERAYRADGLTRNAVLGIRFSNL